jgi:glycosyltransferase involved in cell wall biosynthesis
MKPKLSVLIASTFDREKMTEKLRDKINYQAKDKPVEVNVCYDNKEMSIGAKRQKMLEEANGEYVCFVDSDDDIADYYIDEILQAIDRNADCVGFDLEVHGLSRRGRVEKASASKRWKRWANRKGGYDYVRTIYHKNPVRRSIALQIGFKDMRFAEDHDYSERLQKSGLLKFEIYIDKPMYIYQYKYEDHKTKYGYDKDEE